ncbi:MAG: methyltransferase domain-containing protein [Betaproteobacteria bacterium]|nr:methyltransferase domain-containing protein [Betaproteobacteria bacterium]
MNRKQLLNAISVVAFASITCGAVLAQSHDTHRHRFGNAEKWSKIFDDPARDSWQKPHEVLMALKLAPNAAVADIGAGTGYFAVRLAHVLPKGRVYAVDAEPDMVKFLGERGKREGLANLTPVIASSGSPRLPSPVDLVLLVDVYHHIAKRGDYFSALRGSLKTGGRIAIIDFTMNTRSGPPKSERIAPERVKIEMESAGYRLAEDFGFLPEQYFLVFVPNKP